MLQGELLTLLTKWQVEYCTPVKFNDGYILSFTALLMPIVLILCSCEMNGKQRNFHGVDLQSRLMTSFDVAKTENSISLNFH